MSDAPYGHQPGQPLSGLILSVLLAHRAASTPQLYELLSDETSETTRLDERLEVLRAQQLAVHHGGAWYLTQDEVEVACSQPECLGRRQAQAITVPGSAAAHDALALTGLELLFRRQHRAAYPRVPFGWDAPVVHRFRAHGSASALVGATARLRTCLPRCRPLLAMDALVDLLPSAAQPQSVGARLRGFARFEASGPPDTARCSGPWRRWYPRAPYLLMVARTRSGIGPLLEEIGLGVAGLLRRGRFGLAVLAELERHGAGAPVWASPYEPARRRWDYPASVPDAPIGAERIGRHRRRSPG